MSEENTGWKEATSGDVVKLKEGERIEGKLVTIEPSTQYPESFCLKLDTKDGLKVTFVSNIVKDLIESNSIMKGQDMAVLFKGLKKSEKSGREYKDYSVLFK